MFYIKTPKQITKTERKRILAVGTEVKKLGLDVGAFDHSMENQVVDTILCSCCPKLFFLFGSVSSGKARYGSDIDVPSVMESNEKPACRGMEILCDLDMDTSVVLIAFRGRNVVPKVFVRTF